MEELAGLKLQRRIPASRPFGALNLRAFSFFVSLLLAGKALDATPAQKSQDWNNAEEKSAVSQWLARARAEYENLK